MDFDFRFATPADTNVIVGFLLDAGGGLFEQLIEDVVPAIPLRDLVAVIVADDQSPFNFRNCLMAERTGRCVGMALCYPAAQFGLPPIALGAIPEERLEPVREIMQARVEGSYYLNTLAVAREAAGHGLGQLLLKTAAELGRGEGFETISLQAWTDNETAFRLYERLGFTVDRLIEAGPSTYLRYQGPMALMSAPIDTLLAARSVAAAFV